MGIYRLLQYVKDCDIIKFAQYESDTRIYISDTIYYDATYKLIELYHKYATNENGLDEIVFQFRSILNGMSKHNRKIYVFIDYRICCEMEFKNILFMDYLPMYEDFDEIEKTASIPFVNKENSNDIICGYEMKRYNLDENKYERLIDKTFDDEFQKVNYFANGWFRYLYLRGGKLEIKRQRIKNIITESKNNCHKFAFIKVFETVIREISDGSTSNTYPIFGCEVESDFSLVKHIRTYNRNSYPTIYTNDTDMLALLCDVNCIVHITVKREYMVFDREAGDDVSGQSNIDNEKSYISKSVQVNPKLFWERLLGGNIEANIIKIICVLMGTDYNPYTETSIIHIKRMSDILRILNVDSYSDIEEELLMEYIFEIFNNNPDNKECRQTALALNIYLNNLEGSLHELNYPEIAINNIH